MTVREWFRVQRGALYAQEQPVHLFWVVDTLATAIVNRQPTREYYFIAPHTCLVFSPGWLRRELILEQLRLDMHRHVCAAACTE